MNLNEGASRKPGEKGLMTAPVHPRREACERERASQTKVENKEQGQKTANNTRSNFNKGSNKGEQANCGKQMKSRVRHLV